jgi:hypothetical protein
MKMRAGGQLCTRNPADPAATAISKVARSSTTRPTSPAPANMSAAGSGAAQAPVTAAACALLLTFVTAVDTCTVLVPRWRAGRRWTQGGADHLAHRLRTAGLSTSRAVLTLSATAAAMAILAVIVDSGIVPATGALAATVTVGLALVVLAQRVKVYGPPPQTEAAVPGPGELRPGPGRSR